EANEIAIAVSPTALIVYGPRTERRDGPTQRIEGVAAVAAAKEHNGLIVDGAIDWVAAHPDHARFATMKMPAPVPIVTILDGGSQMARRANGTTDRRPINRLRPEDINIEPLPKDRAI
ncbi:MAG: hypothetical protein QOF79_224, partial [Actinomycetota bacterium]|nr:hypothetical protein [Actinomycetota bacterium]